MPVLAIYDVSSRGCWLVCDIARNPSMSPSLSIPPLVSCPSNEENARSTMRVQGLLVLKGTPSYFPPQGSMAPTKSCEWR